MFIIHANLTNTLGTQKENQRKVDDNIYNHSTIQSN